MLNISNHKINGEIDKSKLKSLQKLKSHSRSNLLITITITLLILGILALFLPWTQSVNGKGYVTTLSPESRPQSVPAIIAGKLEKWYVREGDLVKKGDTLAYISEVKNEYFDPNLVENTAVQANAKNQSISTYDGKINALNSQLTALQQGMQYKIQQANNKIRAAKNKVRIDSIELVALEKNAEIANNQFQRTQQLYDKGLKSLSDLQDKELKYQQTQAKVNAQQNKLSNQKNELLNARIEVGSIQREYADKMAKTQSDIQNTQAGKLEAIAGSAKLENQLNNYKIRQQHYYILSPQNGWVSKTKKAGIGEIIKEGDDLVTIVPEQQDMAVEFYVKPNDLPLLQPNQNVNIAFDGWPTMVISGWPQSAIGIFKGRVVAIDQNISDNNQYRILVSPNLDYKKWPSQLRIGTGAKTFVLLNEVPIWYEIWRQLNGFPANFYKENEPESVKLKTPIKKVK